MFNKVFLILIFILFLSSINLASVPFESDKNIAPNVFLDCSRRQVDINYVKTEITFVNYVNDRHSADIHLMITRRTTGSGGREYNLKYIGMGNYQEKNTELKFFSKSTDTSDQIRKGLVKKLKQGLIPYISDTPMAEFISISYSNRGKAKPKREVKDKWNYWSFRVGLNGNLESEERSKGHEYTISASADRVTEKEKIRVFGFFRNEKNTYTIDEDDGSTSEYISETNRKMIFASYIRSIDSHWSWGGFFDFYSSTYDNADAYYTFAAGIEYNIFPYKDYSRRELRVQYKLEYINKRYFELTVYDKLTESLARQRLQIVLAIKEAWGAMGFQLSGLAYFHDFAVNNLRTDFNIRVNLIRGLSFNINGNYSRVRDQLSLPMGGASKDEVLMELKQLATGYNFKIRMGLSFRFGSIYNNVVNPRFGMDRFR